MYTSATSVAARSTSARHSRILAPHAADHRRDRWTWRHLFARRTRRQGVSHPVAGVHRGGDGGTGQRRSAYRLIGPGYRRASPPPPPPPPTHALRQKSRERFRNCRRRVRRARSMEEVACDERHARYGVAGPQHSHERRSVAGSSNCAALACVRPLSESPTTVDTGARAPLQSLRNGARRPRSSRFFYRKTVGGGPCPRAGCAELVAYAVMRRPSG